jgi:hypothetical protein
VLAWALRAAGEAAVAGERDADILRRVVVDILTASPAVQLDYAEVVDAHTLQPSATIGAHTLVAVAAFVGTTRLIDNIEITVTPGLRGDDVTVDTGVITPSFTDPTFADPPLAAAAAEVAIP